jgi:hypothetical protein
VETITPLSSCITPGVISDKGFASGILKYIFILTFMFISCEMVNDFRVGMSVWYLDQYW